MNRGDKPTSTPSQEGNWPRRSAPLLGGAGGGFVASTHVKILEVFSFHEPERGQPCPRGHGCPRSSPETFMVPIHGVEAVQAGFSVTLVTPRRDVSTACGIRGAGVS